MTAPQITPGRWEQRSYNVWVEGKGTLCSVRNPWNNEAERMANAKAIAAVPLLIQALRPFAGHVGKAGEKVTLTIGKDSWTGTLTTDDFERVRSALLAAGVISQELKL
jgi:hypothetical protein